MTVIRWPPPHAKQREFMLDKHPHVAFGGARGGGKSWAVRQKAARLCIRYPGIRVLIVRRTYRELINNHVIYLQEDLNGSAKFNKSDMVFKFVNGSTISFGYCNGDNDLMQYQGVQYDVIFIDEATQLEEDWIRKITACRRGTNDFPKRIYYTCNPGGVGHQYIKRLFIDRRYEPGENAEDYSFIQSKVTDNLTLMRDDPMYMKTLQALPPKLKKAWLDGDWGIFEGQFFEDFIDRPEHYQDRQWTHVIDPFEIPAGWTIYRSFDFGYGKPFSVGWWAVDYQGRLYRILELYGCTDEPNTGVKWPPDRIFQQIAKTEREHRWLKGKDIIGVADPSIWDGSRGIPISEMAAQQGVYFTKGINARLPGWMQVHYRLAFDEDGFPQMYVFRTCSAFIRTIPLMQYDPHDPEDLDTTAEDHVADEVRYMCMARPIKPVIAPDKPAKAYDPLSDDREDESNERYQWARI